MSHALCSMKRGLNASAKGIDSGQPAQLAQADLGRDLSLSVNFRHSKTQSLPHMCVVKEIKKVAAMDV